MQQSKNSQKCAHPEKLQGKKPGQCSPQQILDCHGKVVKSPVIEALKAKGV